MKHKKTFTAFLIILALMIVAVATHTIWLEAMAKYLIVKDDELVSADVIVILGGGGPDRVEHAVKLYQSGYAKWIMATGMHRELPGIVATWPQLAMRHAVSMGVPDTAFILEERSTSTYEDAQYVREDMLERGFQSAIIVSSPFHMRRSRMAFRKIFKDQEDISLQFSPVEYDSSQTRKWWTREGDLINVVNEYCKLTLYFFKYTI
jgi:uncharacterized SAM-binding protein YcdF (DUF218 family)